MGARIKTTSKCCFYHKRRSFVNEQAKRVYKTSDRATAVISLMLHGGIAQLGERLNGIQKVRGSIPLTSTNKRRV